MELHFDAGRYHETWWGAFLAWRRHPDESTELLVKEQGQIEGEHDGPTVPEGIAAIAAFRWLVAAEEHGKVLPYEPLVVAADNFAVARKLETGSTRGRYSNIWGELERLTRRYRESERFSVWPCRSYNNCADPLAVEHENPRIWSAFPPLPVH